MPGQPPPDGPDDRTVLHALPEDQPDSLSEGAKSNQADLDGTPAENANSTGGTPNQSGSKSDWQSYAQAQGVDTDGMTKDDIIDAVS